MRLQTKAAPVLPPPVFFKDIGQDLVPEARVEVQIDVRRVVAAGVEEALEVEVELDRVDVREAEEIGQERRRARALEVVEDAVAPGELDDVVDDEKVGREPRRLDDGQLALGPLALVPAQVLAARGAGP